MQHTSELYQALLRDPLHVKEVRVRAGGRDYGAADIVSLATSGGLFSSPDIGGCAARQIDLVLREPGELPRQAELRVFLRLRAGERASEWLPKGVFFISTRRLDKLTGTLAIHGYDAMRRAGEPWLTEDYAGADWPMPQQRAAEDIARRMGTTLDPRTQLSGRFPVDYPVDENGDLTMQDILEGIAVSEAGNWVVTDQGKLLLLRLGDIPPETNYLVTEHGEAITLGGVRILVG